MAPTANTSIWASSNHMLVVASARASTIVVTIAANLGPLVSMSMVVLLAADTFFPGTARRLGPAHAGTTQSRGGPGDNGDRVRPWAGPCSGPTQRGRHPAKLHGESLRQQLRGP